MIRLSDSDAPSIALLQDVLFQKLDPSDSANLLKDSLGHDTALLKDACGGKPLSHMDACRCLVALNGVQLIRNRGIRRAIVKAAHLDQIIACFSELLRERLTLTTHKDYSSDEMRKQITEHAWHSGSAWARAFCASLNLPQACAGREFQDIVEPFELVDPFISLFPLHDFQDELRIKLEKLFTEPGRRALVALPTGAGKTRLLVETALGIASVADGTRSIVWIAQHDELCEQAVQCFAQVWRSQERPLGRPLRIQRVWKSLNKAIDWDSDVIVGTPESLTPRLRESTSEDRLRPVLAVVDEAHHALAPSYGPLFSLLGQCSIVGITATPGSTLAGGAALLKKRFGGLVLTSDALGPNPIGELQTRRILAEPLYETHATHYRVDSEILTSESVQAFGDLPPQLLERLGKSSERNKIILDRLLDIPADAGSVLCFASSVTSSRALAAALAVSGRAARSIDATTERWTRTESIDAFKAGCIQYLINYGVLATGFDAPKVQTLVLARPTTSAVLFEQMLGRGLRGPLNGGTEECNVIYFEDDFTEFGGVRPLGYMRFLEE